MTAQEQRLLARLPEIRTRSLGRTFTVQESKHIATRGEIVDVEFARFRYTPRSVVMVFKVTMLCGINKVSRSFNVSSLPG